MSATIRTLCTLALSFATLAASPAFAEGELPEVGSGRRATQENDMLSAGDRTAETLHAQLKKHGRDGGAILVASLTDLENMDVSTPFGRLAMQQIASRLGSRGHAVVEARLRRDYVIAPGKGEQMLTRDVTALRSAEQPAWAALVGNYSRTRETVYVSVRVVRLEDGVQLAAEEYRLPLSGDVRQLFGPVGGGRNQWAQYAMRDPAFTQGKPSPAGQGVADDATASPATLVPADPATLPTLKAFPPLGGEGRKVVPASARGKVKQPAKATRKIQAKSSRGGKPRTPAVTRTPSGGVDPVDMPGPRGQKDA